LARTIEYDHTPITNKFEIFSIIAFSISFSYFILELSTDIRGTGAFIILFSLIFQTVSSVFISHTYQVPDVLRNRLLGLHVISALLGYSGITISAVYGVLYILLYKNLKENRFGLIFERLPSLEILQRLTFNSTVIGFILLTLAIVIGGIWLPEAFPNFSYLDPKLVSTLLVWLIFGYGLFGKLFLNWYGKKIVYFSLIGFLIAMISLIITTTMKDSFHSFY
jgi:ABC-type uncharacterized transport system permease subunit